MTVGPRAVIFGCAGLRLTGAERRLFALAQPWGAILFARNIESPGQVLALTQELRATVGRDMPILIDQEGGRVQRLRPPHWRDWPPALEQCARASSDAMRLRGQIIAAELRALGIDVNCAPLADIARPETHAILRNRCYGTNLNEVVRNARAMADGLLSGGVLPVLKHIPGHGRATLDSHLALPVVDASHAELLVTDFAAFAALADLPLGMTAHLVFRELDNQHPVTHSRHLVGLIRDEIGFGGLLMTDDISMQALAGPLATRAGLALAAGCDLVLHCNGDLSEMEELAEICPPLDTAGVVRSTRALAMRARPPEQDLAVLERAYREMMGDA